MGDFYDRTGAIHEVAEARRSQICCGLIMGLMPVEIRSDGPKRILDVGCGDGSFISQFKEFFQVYGVDISQRAVRLATEAEVNAHRVDASFEKLPFENEHFDLVYMGDIIEHLINPDFAIKEVARVMKPTAFLVLSTPNLASWLNRVLLLLGIQPLFTEVSTVEVFKRGRSKSDSRPVGHLRLFTIGTLKRFLNYYRFEVTKTKGSPAEGIPRVLSVFDRLFSGVPSLSSIIVVVARKKS
jgi:ubiquinone/menaquinone biosynthesis C-methylase UbiE